jgi:long-chain acyl-CoA synthetase
VKQRTLPNLFEESVEKYSNNPLMWEKTSDKYEPLTYAEMKPLVYNFAAGLLKLGLLKGDRTAFRFR